MHQPKPKTQRSRSMRAERLFDYDIVEVIGEGAGSMVYAACRRKCSTMVALKHVVCRDAKRRRFVNQLKDEYEVGRVVRHDGLRQSLALHIRRDWFFRPVEAVLVLELFDGMSLDRQRPTSVADTVACMLRVAHALRAMHAQGFVHCDLKPNNILLDTEGRVKLIDLGQACRVGTRKKRIQGTPDYMAPEQVRREPVTDRTDVFNFGATMYWVLSQQTVPTLYTAGRGTNKFVLEDRIPTPHELNPHVPPPLSELTMSCLSLRPPKRPGIDEVIRRLEVIEFSVRRNAAASARTQKVQAT
jgi:serine/threonine protein kinase